MENIDINHFSIEEQQSFGAIQKAKLKEFNLDFSEDKFRYLGLNPYNFSVSYYIGIDWLNENNYIVVHPKIPNLDYVGMFVHCLKLPEISKHLKEEKVYDIDFQKPQIKILSADWDLTPFLIVHFLSIVEKIAKQGLKSNYIVYEENMNSKIKGKIVFSQQIKKNIVAKREDRIFCRYQEYSINCIENRLLKKALLFIQRYSKCYREQYPALIQKQNRLLSAFDNISDEISYSEIKRIKINSLYKEYVEAVDLAKKILRHFGYSYKKAEQEEKRALPPFWIDMSKLFELYVYSLLREKYGSKILYQQKGEYGEVDFLKIDDKYIIDTKYKEIWRENFGSLSQKNRDYLIKDIRQLSGYARDRIVLEKLGIIKENSTEVNDSVVADCIIIYPDDGSNHNFSNVDLKDIKIEQFTKFYKCGIWLPKKT